MVDKIKDDEDDLLPSDELTWSPPDLWARWIGRACLFAVGSTFCNFLAILCVLGWRWVMNR